MEKRILTLVIELDNKDDTLWIWDAHKEQKIMNGIRIFAIGEGDQICDCEGQSYGTV